MKKSAPKKLVHLKATKNKRYLKVLRDIKTAGVCPFCPENFKWHTKPILKRKGNWLITENFNPYKNARYHFLLVDKIHKEKFRDVTPKDWQEISTLANWAIKKYKIEGGAFAFRFGEPTHTGASVTHLHAHLIVPKLKNKRAIPVFFPVG